MSSFEQLEAEVGKLRREIRRLKGNSVAANKATVEEIVGTGGETADGSGAFSRALREHATSDGQQQHREIVAALRSNPELCSNPTTEWTFRNQYPWIDYNTMSGLIKEAKERAK